MVQIGDEYRFTKLFATKKGARTAVRKLKEKLNFDSIETVQGEGCYPDRARMLEELYQKSGRTNGLYTGLGMTYGTVSDDTTS